MSEDPRQYLNDNEEGTRLAQDGHQARIWTAMPGIVQSVDLTKMTCVVQLAIQGRAEQSDGTLVYKNIALLQDVPIVFPRAGGFTITFPLAAGDEVLVVFASRCIDAWWQNGGYENKPMEFRMHDLSDGFAIPGPSSQPKKIAAISTTEIQIRNDSGDTYLSIVKATKKFGMKNPTTDLKTIMTDLESALNTFATTLAGYGGGGAPATQAQLQAPGAALQAALVPILTNIGALLK
ncbi:MAG: Gp138 family membrane-puncturing spike protein [Nitrospirota bacterium]|nr:Gp138 family membrane-puncturing spike protein [Nitrospirota bacterium]